MAAFDFFAQQDVVRPNVTETDASRIVRELYGIEGVAREIGSNQDRNFRIVTPDDHYLLKIDNHVFTDRELLAQNHAMTHLSSAGILVPTPVRGHDLETLQHWEGDGERCGVRLLTYLDGSTLVDGGYLASTVVRGMGRLTGRVAAALASLEDVGLERNLQWDVRRSAAVVEHLSGSVGDASQRDLVLRRCRAAAARLEPVVRSLRVRPIHGDLTDDNMVCTRPSHVNAVPDGVIDFGDVGLGWLVAELAVMCSSVLHHQPDEPLAVLDAIRAFDEVVPLTSADITALWPLIVLRTGVLVVSGHHQVTIDAGNEYAVERMAGEWEMFQAAQEVDWDAAEAAIQVALGRPERHTVDLPEVSTPMLGGLGGDDCPLLDLTTTSPLLNEGRWLRRSAELDVAAATITGRQRGCVAPYAHARSTRAAGPTLIDPQTFPLFTEVFAASGQPVVLPVDGTVRELTRSGLRIGADGFELRVDGVASVPAVGEDLRAGDVLGTGLEVAPGIARIRVQGLRHHGLEAPWYSDRAWAPAWRRLTFDPAPLLGVPVAGAPFDAAMEIGRREEAVVAAQERYYERPPQIERGWREYLIDTTGRPYLDMVNNVSGIGHSHPRLIRAVHDQMQLLNTNSRFLYRAFADLVERLVEVAPDPSLDTVLLVNSGTEAVDLSLRLAQVHTGRQTIVALQEGYHGWSMAADAVSTSAYDNPNGLGSRPDWVAIADSPNTYRGTYRGTDTGPRYVADLVALLDRLEAEGRPVGGFICEPVLGNAGGVLLPGGYLDAVYAQVRRRGGVVIADEVQVGYGRLGDTFWGVQQQGVVPDIISVAKAMGNTYPLGAVITRKEIAQSLSRVGMFFSSAGGAPVACVAGLAVLDIMRDERLQQNARTVGDHLASRLRMLGRRHPLIGAVHGHGLYLGLELVRSHDTLEPATEETAAVCERLLRLGVIMQPTSERRNVLKIKPPLCLTQENADFFIDALDVALTGLPR